MTIDEETDHQIVHRRRFRKTNGAAHEPLDPGPQVDVFALDFLRIGVPVVLEQLWKASHNCPYRRSIVMEGNYNLSRYHLAFCLNFFP